MATKRNHRRKNVNAYAHTQYSVPESSSTINWTSDNANGDNAYQLHSETIIEYSMNFHRHIAKERINGCDDFRAIESFLWLDEALDKYPDATLVPILWHGSSNDSSEDASMLIAGDVCNSSMSYPINRIRSIKSSVKEKVDVDFDGSDSSIVENRNVQRIREVLTTMLKWYPSQVDNILSTWAHLSMYPADVLEERLRFLLAPLPDETILAQVNTTEDIDWPKLLYNPPFCGAGMSVAQVSHALQALPDPLLLRLSLSGNSTYGCVNPQKLLTLYEQTPSVVQQITHTVLASWLQGANSYDCMALAYLHWRGWEWKEVRVMLHSFPSIIQCRLEPSWRLFDRGDVVTSHDPNKESNGTIRRKNQSNEVRKTLMADALHYLQMRLHLRPWQIHAMLKTHPRLTGYTNDMLQRKINYFQSRLCLSSSSVRSILLLMPSLLGASTDALDSRVKFWTNEVGLSLSELQRVAAEKPSILQYSVERNLVLKKAFFAQSLSIETVSLVKITVKNPTIWGRSLERNLRPTAEAFCHYFDGAMTLSEYGQLVVSAPDLMGCNWNGNLKEKIEFLQHRLHLDKTEVKSLIQSCPRLLMQSVSKSLQPKIEMLEFIDRDDCRRAVQMNPSLLLNSKSVLETRIERFTQSRSVDMNLAEALTRSSACKNLRRHRKVCVISSGSVEVMFDSATDAACKAGMSLSNMYNVIRNCRPVNGKHYVFEDKIAEDRTSDSVLTIEVNNGFRSSDLNTNETLETDGVDDDSRTSYLTIEIAGAAYPPESTVRGRRRAGGMALCVRGWSELEWRTTCAHLWKGWRVRLLPTGPIVILGYPYLRPSRRRCTLYSCREALRVAYQWLSEVQTVNAHVTIVTESNYVRTLLQNSSQVLEWSRAKTKDDLEFIDPVSRHEHNPDILHTLTRSYSTLVLQEKNKNVSIQFKSPLCHKSDAFLQLLEGAQLAAKLMFDTIRR